MTAHELAFPRLVYRGAIDDSAETLAVADAGALDVAMKAGYRLQRNPKAEKVADKTFDDDAAAAKKKADDAAAAKKKADDAAAAKKKADDAAAAKAKK